MKSSFFLILALLTAPAMAYMPDSGTATFQPLVSYGTQVSGTIVSVKGHLVTLQQSGGQVVVDDSIALRTQQTGRVAVGRQVTCKGYESDGVFYVTQMITHAPIQPAESVFEPI